MTLPSSSIPLSAVSEESRSSDHLRLVPTGTISPPNTFYVRRGKRVFDLVASTLLMCVFAIPMAVLAIVIRLGTPGNPIFVQRRVGRGGQEFSIYKFRTMVQASQSELVLLKDEDGEFRHKVRNDPRITRIGSFLRKTSLDELPQLINVVRGDMSLVGPRPELSQLVAGYSPWQHERHCVRPGITGLWQVSGRSDLPMHENSELDIEYVEQISARLDMAIVGRTIMVVVRGVGAF